MATKDWEQTVNQKDYKVWRNDATEKQVAVYRSIFMVLNLKSGKNRNFHKANMSQAITSAKSYMRSH